MKPVKILSWNVNGLRSRLRDNHLNWFLNEKPDILCLQELKATEDQIPEDFLDITGYNNYFSSSEVLEGYSGVGIYSKLEPEKVQKSFGDGKFEEEGRILKVDYGDFVLFNLYSPTGASSQEDRS
ncbi:MAG: exodeoxyribonuclease III [Methanobacterium paludis]|nr:exodeoxyribonuclease III [Methanobacterium paludis]